MDKDKLIYSNHLLIDINKFNGIIYILLILELIEEHMHKYNSLILIMNLIFQILIISFLKIFIFMLEKIDSIPPTLGGFRILELHFVMMDLQ